MDVHDAAGLDDMYKELTGKNSNTGKNSKMTQSILTQFITHEQLLQRKQTDAL